MCVSRRLYTGNSVSTGFVFVLKCSLIVLLGNVTRSWKMTYAELPKRRNRSIVEEVVEERKEEDWGKRKGVVGYPPSPGKVVTNGQELGVDLK